LKILICGDIKGFEASRNLFILQELKLGNEQGRSFFDLCIFETFIRVKAK
jgi:hypothetical protein